MKHWIIAAAMSVAMATAGACAEMKDYLGTYVTTWADGKVGVYAVTAIDATSARVTYAVGGKSQTEALAVSKTGISGSDWFPAARFRPFGILDFNLAGKKPRNTTKR